MEPVVGFGVNLAGAEFGMERVGYSNAAPGKHGVDYLFPSESTLDWYAGHGLRLVRLPVSWERLQPMPGGELDARYLGRLLEFLDLAQMHACDVVVDLHAYGRYQRATARGVREQVVGERGQEEPALLAGHLADLWCRLASAAGSHPAVHAWGLMNEPHDMGRSSWHAVSQAVVTALRGAGDPHWLWVAGDGWSKAHEWNLHNPPEAWIEDPLRRTVYEAHLYFDVDGSGRYRATFAEEVAMDPKASRRGVERLQPFLTWCARNRVRGVIGEFGVPWYDEGWLPVLDGFLDTVEAHGLTACAWAGGDWWGDYALSLQPRGGEAVPALRRITSRATQRGSRP